MRDMSFDRLCENADPDRYRVIRSHAKIKAGKTTHPSTCEVCRWLECTDTPWGLWRDALLNRLNNLKSAADRGRVLTWELERARAESAPQEALTEIDDRRWIEYLDLLATQDEVKTAKSYFADQQWEEWNMDTVKVASQLMRTRPWATFYGFQTRKFFLGHFQDNEESFRAFEEGKFDETLIVDYSPPEVPDSSIPTEMGVDLSPPGGVFPPLPAEYMDKLRAERDARYLDQVVQIRKRH